MAQAVGIDVDLPSGTLSLPGVWSQGSRDDMIVIAHGAGAGKDHPFLVGFADALADEGLSTLRFDFAYVAQGRRMPGPAAHAIAAWSAVVEHARARMPHARIWAAGKSYGGRMASMAVSSGLVVDGLIYLGYPLHAPGKPEKPRAEHLPAIRVPQLFLEGTNDPFIQPLSQFDDVVATCTDARVEWIDGGGHSFEVKGRKRTASEVGASLAPIVTAFVDDAGRSIDESTGTENA